MQRSALCRYRRELSNEYFIAKFGFDAAENEPSKDDVDSVLDHPADLGPRFAQSYRSAFWRVLGDLNFSWTFQTVDFWALLPAFIVNNCAKIPAYTLLKRPWFSGKGDQIWRTPSGSDRSNGVPPGLKISEMC